MHGTQLRCTKTLASPMPICDRQFGVRGQGYRLNQLLRRNVKRFRGGLVFKAHRLLYHSTLGLREIKKKKKKRDSSALTTSWSGSVSDFGFGVRFCGLWKGSQGLGVTVERSRGSEST